MVRGAKCMNGLCPCGQDASRRLCVSLCVTKESPLRRSLKVLSLPRGRYRDDLNDLVREITERTESSGEVFRIADGHFDPGLLSTRKFNQQQQVPTRSLTALAAGHLSISKLRRQLPLRSNHQRLHPNLHWIAWLTRGSANHQPVHLATQK